MIAAEAWSDCRQFNIKFDATLWAKQASDQALLDLGKCGFRGDYAADDVVLFMAKHDGKAASLFEFLQVVRYQINGDTNGFECAVDEDDLRNWLKEHKPHLIEKVFTDD